MSRDFFSRVCETVEERCETETYLYGSVRGGDTIVDTLFSASRCPIRAYIKCILHFVRVVLLVVHGLVG